MEAIHSIPGSAPSRESADHDGPGLGCDPDPDILKALYAGARRRAPNGDRSHEVTAVETTPRYSCHSRARSERIGQIQQFSLYPCFVKPMPASLVENLIFTLTAGRTKVLRQMVD